jgi:hypothetical protein
LLRREQVEATALRRAAANDEQRRQSNG